MFHSTSRSSLLKKTITRVHSPDGDKEQVNCNICKHTYGTSAASRSDKWFDHVTGRGCIPQDIESQIRKNEVIDQLRNISKLEQERANHSTNSTQTTSNATESTCDILTQEKFNECLSDFIFGSGIAFTIVENPYFIKLVQLLNPTISLPSRKFLSTILLNKKYEQVNDYVTNILTCHKEEQNKLTLHCDSWTNVRNESLTSYIVSSPLLKSPIYIESSLANYTSKDSNYALAEYKRIINKLGSQFVSAITTDNASELKKAKKDIQPEFPNVMGMGCICHLLNIFLTNFENKSEELRGIKKIAKDIVLYFKEGRKRYLLKIIKQNSTTPDLYLCNATRWCTTIKMIRNLVINRQHLFAATIDPRFLSKEKIHAHTLALVPLKGNQLDEALSIKSKIGNDDIWNSFHKFITLLEPIETMILKNEIEHPRLEVIYSDLENLKSLYTKSNDSATKLLYSIVDEKIREHGQSDIYKIAHILNPMELGNLLPLPEVMRLDKVMCDFFETEEEKVSLAHQLVSFRSAIQQAKETEIKGLMKGHMIHYFRSLRPHLGLLSRYGQHLFAVSPSNGNIERLFSMFGHLHSRIRNRLTNANAEKLIFIYYNMRLKEKETFPSFGIHLVENIELIVNDSLPDNEIMALYSNQNQNSSESYLSDDCEEREEEAVEIGHSDDIIHEKNNENDDDLISSSIRNWEIAYHYHDTMPLASSQTSRSKKTKASHEKNNHLEE